MKKIEMVDLHGQYLRLKPEIDSAIHNVVQSTRFIQGPEVKTFTNNLSQYLGGSHVITCGNGTDALQIAMMALDLKPGDEVIIPAFTYVAVAEVIALLGITPVLADVDQRTFNIDIGAVKSKITVRTRAIVPVHLFGQLASMEDLVAIATEHKLIIIEDAAQALGSAYEFRSLGRRHAGTIGTIGITSFFPTKTLGCFGDGGAILTTDATLAEKIRMIANHGQKVKYVHDMIGVNSRLDTIQASILDVKLRYISDFTHRRQQAAAHYDRELKDVKAITIPFRDPKSTHVFHQYTVHARDRDQLKKHLEQNSVPSMIYYPLPLHFQKAYGQTGEGGGSFPVAEALSKSVISLPIHTEMEVDQLNFICEKIRGFYND